MHYIAFCKAPSHLLDTLMFDEIQPYLVESKVYVALLILMGAAV